MRAIEPITEFQVFPCTVIVDTREQLPYTFAGLHADARDDNRPLIVRTERRALRSGDYSMAGFEDRIAIERKSLTDLYGTIGGGRDRFEAELERLNSLELAAVVIESDWLEILTDPPPGRRLTPKVVYRSIIAWSARYVRVHWFPMPGRMMAERTTFRLLEKYYTGCVHGRNRQIDAHG